MKSSFLVILKFIFSFNFSWRTSLLAATLPPRDTSRGVKSSDNLTDTHNEPGSHNVSYWKNGVVPYVFSDIFRTSEKDNVIEAMDQISNRTSNCINFTVRTNEENYIKIVRGIGCSADVGRKGDEQIVSLTHGCLEREALGSIQQGFLHALGFYHEISRPDRDQYISIDWSNIATEDRQQFELITDMDTFGLPYDYDSIMHYPYTAFAVDKRIPTVFPKGRKVRIGQKKNLSTLDVAKIQAAYKCA